jgi:hypothetical protein
MAKKASSITLRFIYRLCGIQVTNATLVLDKFIAKYSSGDNNLDFCG